MNFIKGKEGKERGLFSFISGLPEAIVEGLLRRDHPDVHSTILPDTIVGQHLHRGKPDLNSSPHLYPASSCQELVEIKTMIVAHLFYFIDSDGEILAPLIDVVHQAKGQILEPI